MICISTRGQAPAVSLREAVIAGLAPDGGLYVPQEIRRLPDQWWSEWRGREFQDLAVELALHLAGPAFDPGALTAIVRDAMNFPVVIERLDPTLAVVELFHGPTFAFKDFGARMLARLLSHLHDGAGPMTVLVATSGDTGGAVAHAFFEVPGTRVVVLYPEGQVSDVQEAQFTTLGGNVTAVAVRGTFDDCQRLAKAAFADAELRRRARLTSANSISLGRLLPQVFYHAYASLQAPADRPVRISVPSGNFGNLAAGVIASLLGAPIAQFIAPTTVNDSRGRPCRPWPTRWTSAIRAISSACRGFSATTWTACAAWSARPRSPIGRCGRRSAPWTSATVMWPIPTPRSRSWGCPDSPACSCRRRALRSSVKSWSR
jgi:threonine synthase